MRRWEGRSVSLIEWVWPETAKTSWFIVEAKKKKKKKKKKKIYIYIYKVLHFHFLIYENLFYNHLKKHLHLKYSNILIYDNDTIIKYKFFKKVLFYQSQLYYSYIYIYNYLKNYNYAKKREKKKKKNIYFCNLYFPYNLTIAFITFYFKIIINWKWFLQIKFKFLKWKENNIKIIFYFKFYLDIMGSNISVL